MVRFSGVGRSERRHGMTVEAAVPRGPVEWGPDDVPDLSGRRIVVTGASSGLGLILVRHLAGRGATVIMAVRDGR